MNQADRSRYLGKVRAFKAKRPKFVALAMKLKEVLAALTASHAPEAIVQSRAKAVASFAEKILRKGKYEDPVHQMTDLAGARIVTYTMAEAEAVAEQIEREPGIEIDRENSGDTRLRLRTGEFGYRAIHYVVRLKGPKVGGISIDPGLRPLKAEIQVCTMLQHAWSAIGHDRIYKTALHVPEQLKRDVSAVAALLETSDAKLGGAIAALDTYIEEFDAYLSPGKIDEAIERWKAVREVARRDEKAIHSLGRLLIVAGRYGEARTCLRELRTSRKSGVLCDLGRTAWRAGKLVSGRKWLGRALALDPANFMAHCELGASHLETEHLSKTDLLVALGHYSRAFVLAPEDPRVLVPYVECHILTDRSAVALDLMKGTFHHGIEECRRRIELAVRLPESYLERARLLLYAGTEYSYECLRAYARAILSCDDIGTLHRELRALERMIAALRGTRTSRPGISGFEHFEWARRLLVLGAATRDARSRLEQAMKTWVRRRGRRKRSKPPTFALSGAARRAIAAFGSGATRRPAFAPPIVIVAGGCDTTSELGPKGRYARLIQEGFADFEGTIICGGTDAGISGIVARLRSADDRITRIGYLPARGMVPYADREHPAYRIHRHEGRGYSPLGPLQTWADLLLAGIDPGEVRVLGVNGGRLSGFEYVLAAAVGARVGVVERSGRAASDILLNEDWRNEPGLFPLPEDWATVSAFVCAKHPIIRKLPEETVEQGAMEAHELYRLSVLSQAGKVPNRVLDWPVLPDTLKNSNRSQMAYALFTLARAGFDVVPRGSGPRGRTNVTRKAARRRRLPAGYETLVERMAEREHGRYNAERLADGWRRGEDDSSRKTNPSLVPWQDLSNAVKEYDRDAVRDWVRILAGAGYEVVPKARRSPRSASR